MINTLKYNMKHAVLAALFFAVAVFDGCTKDIDIEIPESAKKIVVEGSIENNVPPVVILTRSQRIFDNININDIGAYFVRGAQVSVRGSDGTETELVELCLQNLNLPPEQAEVLLNALGFTTVDSGNIPNVCVYTVPDILSYFLTGTCSFMGKERTSYDLRVMAPGFDVGDDTILVTSTTYIPTAIGMDSLGFKEHTNPAYRDSFVGCYAYITVPDTFGNFVRYWTQRNDEPQYKPRSQSVWDDKLFVGLSLGLPLERGQPRTEEFDINTYTYFRRGDTITVKWSNIDSKTYDFFYTLENDGGDSPFSSPVLIKTNINNGLGIWAGYATKKYKAIAPW